MAAGAHAAVYAPWVHSRSYPSILRILGGDSREGTRARCTSHQVRALRGGAPISPISEVWPWCGDVLAWGYTGGTVLAVPGKIHIIKELCEFVRNGV